MDGKQTYLGTFPSEMEAAIAVDQWLRKRCRARAGLLKKLNFLQDSDYFCHHSWQDEVSPAGKTSRFLGVYWGKAKGKFVAKVFGRYLGLFDSELTAALAFDAASLAEGGRTNFHPYNYVLRDRSSLPSSKAAEYAKVHQELPEDKVTAFRQEESQDGQISACDCRFARHDPITVRQWWYDFTHLTGHTAGRSFRTTAGDLGQILTSAADRSSDSQGTLRGLGRLLADLAGCVSLLLGTVPAHPWPLCGFSGNEAEARMIVDVFLKRICRKCSLRLSLETPVPASAAIAGKADYTLWQDDVLVAVVEAKRCSLPADAEGRRIRAQRFERGMAQTCALLRGFALSADTAQSPWGIVTDGRAWLLVRVEEDPVVQTWPQGQALLELTCLEAGPEHLDVPALGQTAWPSWRAAGSSAQALLRRLGAAEVAQV
ncbi:unnamed protein product [Effrenium voratum]|nr:unnamed protein product [Effrenium voratum]